MVEPNQPSPLDFEAIEHQQNLMNLADMADEIGRKSERLRTRILHFSRQFDIPEEDFWNDLSANPDGPLAAVLAREARRQNIHEQAAAEYVGSLPYVEDFRKLPSSGPNACYFNRDGQLVTKAQLAGARAPSKSIDFQWRTGSVSCYAAQKYTKVGGGNQDSQYNEVQSLLQNFLQRINNNVALFILVDGPYYDGPKLARLRALVRTQSPKSYVASVNELVPILRGIVATCAARPQYLFDTPNTG